MKKFYMLFMGGALMACSSIVFGQAIQLDDNHSLSGFPLNGKLILTSDRDSTFWSSDGTAINTVQFSTVKSADEGFALLNNKLYFSGLNAANGAELWVTDGTGPGTVLVSDIWGGPDSSKPSDFFVFNNKVFFTAYTSSLGRELYEYTGSGSPTSITDLNGGSANSFDDPLYFLLNNVMYFDAINSTGKAIYGLETTGTITKILDLPTGYSLTGYEHIGNTLFFSISNGSNGMSIYKTTGVSAASVVHNFTGTFSGLISTQMINWKDKIYFNAIESGFDNELWVTDGTTTNMVADINPGSQGSNPILLNSVELKGLLVFSASTTDSGSELWTTDGTTGGTSMLIDLNTSPGEGSNPFLMPVFKSYEEYINSDFKNTDFFNRKANYNGYIFFSADNGSGTSQLYKTDGTPGGTQLVKTINATGDGVGSSYIYTSSGLVFEGNDGTGGNEPWISDGSNAGTTPIVNINSAGDSDPQFMFIWNGDIYLNADNGNGGTEQYYDLYKLTGPYSAIPVTLANFAATATPENVLLTWNTSSENNSDEFIIMRSTDGEHFDAIGNVTAAGHSNTPKNYAFVDNDAYNQGVNKLYYRLNMRDKDGRSNFSKIVPVKLNDLPMTLSLYPNPVRNVLKIKYNAPQGGLINISGINGKVLYKGSVSASTVGMHEINVSTYPSGTYFLKLVQGGKTTIQKFIKE